MFDLFRSRAKAVRYLLGGLLMLVAISMVITLIPGYGSSTRGGDDPVLAVIGKEKLTAREVTQAAQNFMRSSQISSAVVEAYLPTLIDQMIQDRAVVYQAERMGLTVTDDEVVGGLQGFYPNFFQNGQLVSREAVEQALAQQGMTINDWIDGTRKQLIRRKLMNVALEGLVVSNAEVEQEYKRRHEKAKVQYIAFPPAKFRSQATISDDDVKKQFESHRGEYTIPEKRSFDMILIDEAKVSESMTVTESDLRALYNSQRERFRNPERVHVRHILLKTQGKPDSEKPKLKAKAEDLLKQLKAGADFAELAKKNSEDTVSAAKGGDLDWIVRGQTVKPFEDAAFSLPPRQLSGVISTEYGFHIIQVLEKESPRTRTFDEVKEQLAAEFKKQGVFDKMQALADQARADLTRNPQQAAEIARKLNLQFAPAAKVGPGDSLPLVGASPEIDGAVASLKKGEVTPVVQLPANRLALAAVTDVFPARPADLDEVKEKVRDRVLNDRSQILAQERAKEAAEKLKGGADIEKLAKSMGLEVTTTREFGRGEAVEGLGSTIQLEDVFGKPVGSVVGPMMLQGRNVVLKLTEYRPADMSAMAAGRDSLVLEVKKRKAVERQELFFDSILARLIQEGKVKVNRDVVKRVIAQYRRG